MKKIIISIMIFSMILAPQLGTAISVYLTEEEFSYFKESGNWNEFFDAHYYPQLLADDYELLFLAAELNISNGERTKWGERFMFGRLESARSIGEQQQEFIDDPYKMNDITSEVYRLLFGPWIGPGNTVFEETQPKNYRYSTLVNGEWRAIDTTDTTLIRITHSTDTYGSIRYAFFLLVHEIGANEENNLQEYNVLLVRRANP